MALRLTTIDIVSKGDQIDDTDFHKKIITDLYLFSFTFNLLKLLSFLNLSRQKRLRKILTKKLHSTGYISWSVGINIDHHRGSIQYGSDAVESHE